MVSPRWWVHLNYKESSQKESLCLHTLVTQNLKDNRWKLSIDFITLFFHWHSLIHSTKSFFGKVVLYRRNKTPISTNNHLMSFITKPTGNLLLYFTYILLLLPTDKNTPKSVNVFKVMKTTKQNQSKIYSCWNTMHFPLRLFSFSENPHSGWSPTEKQHRVCFMWNVTGIIARQVEN